MEKIIKYAVINILNDSVVSGKYSYIPAMGGGFATGDYWKITEKFTDKNKAIKIAKKLYEKYPPVKGEYRNWAVVEQFYEPRKRVADKFIKQDIVFVANPNFIIN